MATRVLLNLRDVTSKCVFSCVNMQQGRCLMKGLLTPNRHLRRMKGGNQEFSNWYHNNEGASLGAKVWKSFAFTVGFSATTFLGATIWEYERIRAKALKQAERPYRSAKDFASDMKKEWRSLGEGTKVFAVICGLNILVFGAWRLPQYQHIMIKYFGSNLTSSAVCLPMLLSCFSHYSFLHMAVNMYVLHSFSNAATAYLGREQFLALYLTSGVVSGFASNLFKFVTARHSVSVGASGAIFGIVSFVCCQFPDTRLAIILFPFVTFQAGDAIKALMAFDAIGAIAGWKIFDHAAHLGGAMFGMFWQKWGVEHIWRKRGPVLSVWHDIREAGGPRKPG